MKENHMCNINLAIVASAFSIFAGSANCSDFVFDDLTFDAPTTKLSFPFSTGQTWYVCQGYNGYVTHKGNLVDALDLSVDPNSVGKKSCTPATKSSSAGYDVVAPGDGTIAWKGKNDKDMMCIKLDSGGSIKLGHFYSALAVGAHVNRDNTVLGKLTAPGVGTNGGYSHIHMQLFDDSMCSIHVPFGTAFGAPNLSYNPKAKNQWAGTPLSKASSDFDVTESQYIDDVDSRECDGLPMATVSLGSQPNRITVDFTFPSADLDMMVQEPDGTCVMWNAPDSLNGGHHSGDQFNGGTETYTITNGPAGGYIIRAHSHNDPEEAQIHIYGNNGSVDLNPMAAAGMSGKEHLQYIENK